MWSLGCGISAGTVVQGVRGIGDGSGSIRGRRWHPGSGRRSVCVFPEILVLFGPGVVVSIVI